jgi:hypothetical protein
MKTNHFVLKEDGNLYWVKEMPKEPLYNCNLQERIKINGCEMTVCSCADRRNRFMSEMTSAIDQSVLVENQKEVLIRMARLFEWDDWYRSEDGVRGYMTVGKIYSIECEVNITCKWHDNKDACGNETCWDLQECQKNPSIAIVTFHENNSQKVENSAPILNEVFADNGEHSHWVLIDPSSGKKLWSELPEECRAQGYPVDKPSSRHQENDIFHKHISVAYKRDDQENGHSPQDIWNAACQAQLELIAKTFSENGHKGYTDGDRVVFQAISETIKNHPKPVFNQ